MGNNTKFQTAPAAERVGTTLLYFVLFCLIRLIGCHNKKGLSSIYTQLILMVDFNKKTGFLILSMIPMSW